MGTISNFAQALAKAQVAVHYLEVEQVDIIGVSVDVYAHGFKPIINVANTARLQQAVERGEVKTTRNFILGGREMAGFMLHDCRVQWVV